MKVEDYEYMENDDLEDELTLTEERKDELIKKVKNQIIRGNIALHKILRIGENNTEYNFIYDWLGKNEIKISGINGTLSGELENYKYIEKLGINELPEPLEDDEQQRLFLELDNMKKNGVNTDSKEYQDIRHKLIVHNIKLAIWTVGYKYAKSLNSLEIEKEDLEQMAMEPLIKAVDKYDISMGNKFSSYAVPTIYYTIGKEWRKNKNNDVQLRKEWRRLDRFEEEMLKNVNRKPTDEEIKEFLGISDSELERLKNYINYHLRESLDNLNKEDEDLIINDLLDDEIIEEVESKPILNGIYMDEDGITVENNTRQVDIAAQIPVMKKDLEKMLDTLKPIEKEILELRFGLDGRGKETSREVRTEI